MGQRQERREEVGAQPKNAPERLEGPGQEHRREAQAAGERQEETPVRRWRDEIVTNLAYLALAALTALALRYLFYGR